MQSAGAAPPRHGRCWCWAAARLAHATASGSPLMIRGWPGCGGCPGSRQSPRGCEPVRLPGSCCAHGQGAGAAGEGERDRDREGNDRGGEGKTKVEIKKICTHIDTCIRSSRARTYAVGSKRPTGDGLRDSPAARATRAPERACPRPPVSTAVSLDLAGRVGCSGRREASSASRARMRARRPRSEWRRASHSASSPAIWSSLRCTVW